MGTKYSSQSASGYNSVPPADDGTVSEANKGKWSTIKTKLADPVKTLADAINTALGTHFDHGPTALTSNTTLGASHYEKFIQVSGSGVTLSLSDAATLGAGWNCWITNTDTSNSVTIGRATSGDTFNGSAANYTLLPGVSVLVFVIAAATGFRTSYVSDITTPRQKISRNLSLSAAVGSNALTISLKGDDGNDPSTANPVIIPFRNATVATGDTAYIAVTAATSIVVSSGSTLNTTDNIPFRLWVVGFNDGGTFRMGVINCLDGNNGIYALSGFGIASSTAEGGAGAADSAHVIYTGTAVSSKAYTVLGYVTYEAGLATAGTYSAVPTRIQLFNPGVPLPGSSVQIKNNSDAAVATGTTVTANDDTIPQNTEGDQYMSQALALTSAANIVRIEHEGQYSTSAAGTPKLIVSAFVDSVANALATAATIVDNNGGRRIRLDTNFAPGTATSRTYKIRAGVSAAGTTTFNGETGARLFGGVSASFIRVTEIMI